MPTKERLNISIVNEACIDDLKDLRDSLELVSRKRLSLADVIKALLASKAEYQELVKHL